MASLVIRRWGGNVIILNLGCGFHACAHPNVVNIDWSIYIRARASRLGRLVAPMLLKGERRQRFERLPPNVLAYNLKNGIPFPDQSVDVVYHSHVLEHIERDLVPGFLREVFRVLRRGGIHRIVVPDLEVLCRRYVENLEIASGDPEARARHDLFIGSMFEQCVRRHPGATRGMSPHRRFIHELLFGDARRRGETHQWMYDRVNLSHLLEEAGFTNVRIVGPRESRVPQWDLLNLDVDESGGPRKPHSLYVEAER